MRRLATALAAVTFLAVPAILPALAGEQSDYTPAAMSAAQAAGKPIVVDVSATWCGTCAAQKPIVDALLKDPKFKDMVLLRVDYDSQKAVMRKLNVRDRSTFVVFKGKQEVGRSTGDTDKGSIEKLFAKAA